MIDLFPARNRAFLLALAILVAFPIAQSSAAVIVVSNETVLVNVVSPDSYLVQSAGILGGNGTIEGNVTVGAGGTLSPGNSPGLLTILGDLTLNDPSILLMEIGGTGAGLYDQLDVRNIFTAGGVLNLQILSGFTPQAGDSFELFSGPTPGFDAGSFSTVVTNLGPGLAWDTSELAAAGVVRLFAVVPEPSSAALLIVGGLSLRLLRRRKA